MADLPANIDLMQLACGGVSLDLSCPVVMGIVNVTPDSFSDGGALFTAGRVDVNRVLRQAEQMQADGALVLDIGGESTRPGAQAVSIQEELDRVIPAVEIIARHCSAVISVDTSSPEVMLAAAHAGAGMINDVRALQRNGALAAAASTGLPVCLMHMQGEPATMQENPVYADIVQEVLNFWQERMAACASHGIAQHRIVLDPGFGFGKTLAHNISLLRHFDVLTNVPCPVMAGLSRKSMLSRITGRESGDRVSGSVALAHEAVLRGARIVRVHDVAATVDMLRVVAALKNSF